MKDPYASLCLHGTLPLVADPGSPGGVRFAVPGADAPEACVSRVMDLPDAELTLRAFGKVEERSGYVAALAEHGGNAFSVLESPASSLGFPLALVIRHDRERRPADAIDGAVRYQGPAEAAAAWGRVRARALDEALRSREAAALAERWAWARQALAGNPGLMGFAVKPSGVEFVPAGGYSMTDPVMRLTEDADGRCLEWQVPATQLDAAGAAALARKESALGVTTEGGRKRIALEAGADLATAVEAALSAMRARVGLVTRASARVRMARIQANPDAARVVARLAAGLPVLQPHRDGPGYQADEGGAVRTVPSNLLREAQRIGLARLAWEPPLYDAAMSCPRIVVGTGAAARLRDGDVVEAARIARPHPEPRFAKPAYDADLPTALAALRDGLDDDARDALASRQGVPPTDGAGLPGPAARPEAWMEVILGVLSGRCALEGGILRHAGGEAASPSPGG